MEHSKGYQHAHPLQQFHMVLQHSSRGEGLAILGEHHTWLQAEVTLHITHYITITYVAVLGRNQTLFCCVFRPYYRVQSTVAQNFCKRRGSYALHRLIRYSCTLSTRMSPALNGSSVLQRFKCRNTIELHNGIMFNFYLGLPI